MKIIKILFVFTTFWKHIGGARGPSGGCRGTSGGPPGAFWGPPGGPRGPPGGAINQFLGYSPTERLNGTPAGASPRAPGAGG